MKRISKVEYTKQEEMYYIKCKEDKIPYTRQIQVGQWEIFDGENTIWTGDGGYMEFNKALKDAVNREIKNIKNDIRNNSERLD